MFRVAALRQFAVNPEELRSAMKTLPRDGGGTMASVLPQAKGGDEVLRTVAQAKTEVADKKTYAALLALERVFRLRRSPATEALLQFANKWQESPITESGTPGEFLEYLDYFREAGGVIPLASSDEENSVKLMTAHSAKGLEFDHVFILRAADRNSGGHSPFESGWQLERKGSAQAGRTPTFLRGHDSRSRHADHLRSIRKREDRQESARILARVDQTPRVKVLAQRANLPRIPDRHFRGRPSALVTGRGVD
jgi:ATP-dependent exoDNAse (exonuclease V) beta subunit